MKRVITTLKEKIIKCLPKERFKLAVEMYSGKEGPDTIRSQRKNGSQVETGDSKRKKDWEIAKLIKYLPLHERSQEKLLDKDCKALTSRELQAIIAGSDTKTLDVMALADRLLKVIESCIAKQKVEALLVIDRIDSAKAAIIASLPEVVSHRIRPKELKIAFPQNVLLLIRHLVDRKQKHFIFISLNGHLSHSPANCFRQPCKKEASPPALVFVDNIADRDSSIIVAHNYPEGGLYPAERTFKSPNN